MPKLVKIIIAFLFIAISALSAAAQSNQSRKIEGRILIVYFTWAENTVILDKAKAIREANDHVFSMESNPAVDAVTTASVVPPGNTTKLAAWIKEATGGELFSIRVSYPYSCYWDEILDRASREKAKKARPELRDFVDNMGDYDTVFIGFPTWWYTIPMAVAAFVENHDLSGKKIIPFVSHGTSGVAGTVRELKKLLPRTAVLEKEIGIYRSETASAKTDIMRWLRRLGYTE